MELQDTAFVSGSVKIYQFGGYMLLLTELLLFK